MNLPTNTPLLTVIAQQICGVATLTARGSDAADFHSIAVWQLQEALEAAYQAGALAAQEAMRR